ncbi:sec-independent translocation protein mttA/Hcf106 [Oscillochloris trichoides DG-6]|uniref:Sec-independent translocation protein mttA/Hcf106 n=1 Tax=Oscillochloris trichoides DG-6 TaxID=765420 RepID=E1IDK4_9CHLR|nr:twin-arginine translocase TatA/TatE family subunit [Oscillochloris trichoides]EFO80712.1 sec-independent translocation protein mttA/Hcf106 [Oscillochloris trichoides DG-6]
MEIFNIGIPELLMIAIIGLVVFGPERLPQVTNFLGKQVAKIMAWQQNSPEVQALQQIRNEFETEIASLRDELVRTRNQLDVRKDAIALKEELRPLVDLRGTLNGTTAKLAEPTPASAASPAAEIPESAVGVSPPSVRNDPVLVRPPRSSGVPAAGRPTPTNVLAPARTAATTSELEARMSQLSADLQAVIAELQARGHLSADWQPKPPSTDQEPVA